MKGEKIRGESKILSYPFTLTNQSFVLCFTSMRTIHLADQLEPAAAFRRRISFVAQFESVFVFPVFDRRPMASISDTGSVSTNLISWTPNAEHISL